MKPIILIAILKFATTQMLFKYNCMDLFNKKEIVPVKIKLKDLEGLWYEVARSKSSVETENCVCLNVTINADGDYARIKSEYAIVSDIESNVVRQTETFLKTIKEDFYTFEERNIVISKDGEFLGNVSNEYAVLRNDENSLIVLYCEDRSLDVKYRSRAFLWLLSRSPILTDQHLTEFKLVIPSILNASSIERVSDHESCETVLQCSVNQSDVLTTNVTLIAIIILILNVYTTDIVKFFIIVSL